MFWRADYFDRNFNMNLIFVRGNASFYIAIFYAYVKDVQT